MIEVHNISLKINGSIILKNISFNLKRGDFLYITGPSGSGKTTLLRSVYFDIKPISGYIEIKNFSTLNIRNKDIPAMRRNIGIVFQDFKLISNKTIYENIYFILRSIGISNKDAKTKTIKALTNVGLYNKRDNYPKDLSGGEQQRACIARAISNDPFAIIADEPTGNLDPVTANEIFKLFNKISKLGTAVLVATHNYKILKEFPGRIIYLEDGKATKKKINK